MSQSGNPRVLIVTPEVTYLPNGMGNIANYLSAKAGGLADVSAALITSLFEQGADVHIAIPDYREIFHSQSTPLVGKELARIRRKVPGERLHLAEDRAFYYRNAVYSNYTSDNLKIALAFQREVINNIIPRVQPDLIHCNDWMTGLIPGFSRQARIPCLFTIHNIHTIKVHLSYVEDMGIDAAYFWERLFYQDMATDYESTRESNPVDLLTSGVFGAHYVNTVSPTFLNEVVEGRHDIVYPPLRGELKNKLDAGCAVGILNAPDPSFDPRQDRHLARQYGPHDHAAGKSHNKLVLQKMVGLPQDKNAPIFFWPSRLDSLQKGCQLLAEILYQVVSKYWNENLQILFVANGEFKTHFANIVQFHQLYDRVAICDFNEQLARLAYAGSDFVLMPSLFEPCGLPQMIGTLYGTLPVAHDTGGLHDTVVDLDIKNSSGNGFSFKTFDAGGLLWAMTQAMGFYDACAKARAAQISRIMNEGMAAFNHSVTARHYMDLYEKMLKRPLIT